jgi:hypothetical protein
MYHVMGNSEMHTQSEILKESDHLEDLGIDERSILKWTLNE